MSSYAITAEHWQAALEVPKQIALDLAAPLNLRLQAVRMVQAMLKVILKEEKDRDVLKASPKSAKNSGAMPSSSWACEGHTDMTPEIACREHAGADDGMAPVTSSQTIGEANAHADESRGLAGESATKEKNGTSHPSSSLQTTTEPPEPRPRYIGRVGPRKIRTKRK